MKVLDESADGIAPPTAAMARTSIVASGVSEYAKFGRRSGHPEPTLALHNTPHELSELRPTAEDMDFARFFR
jgi:hypothetical protein